MTTIPTLWHFNDVLAAMEWDDGKRHLMIGAGFSAGANAAMAPDHLTAMMMAVPHIRLLFERQQSGNVEQVMGNIVHQSRTDGRSDQAKADLEALRVAFSRAIADANSQSLSVTGHEDELLSRAGTFLAQFNFVFSLNFDQLAYRAFLRARNDEVCEFTDGFNSSSVPYYTEKEYRGFWSTERRHLYYPHGALFIIERQGEKAQKLTRRSTKFLPKRYREQLRGDQEMGLRWICLLGFDLIRPLIVAAGTAEDKLAQIRNSRFLGDAFTALEGISGNLITYGWSMSDADNHLVDAVAANPNLHNLYVGIYGDPCEPDNQRIIKKALDLPSRRNPRFPLNVRFYSSNSAGVWDEPDPQFTRSESANWPFK